MMVRLVQLTPLLGNCGARTAEIAHVSDIILNIRVPCKKSEPKINRQRHQRRAQRSAPSAEHSAQQCSEHQFDFIPHAVYYSNMFDDLQFSDFPIIAAPMAGVTDRPFRKILREINPSLPIMTEMISCHSITGHGGGRNDDTYVGDNIGPQIFGADPYLMGEAARILEDRGAAWIDINMGCPVPKVATRAESGAFLMRDHRLAGEIMRSVVAAVKIPVSVKTRLGWDAQHLDCDDLLRIAEDSGIAFATVHGRTRAQGYSGTADWAETRDAMRELRRMPVIFNGDIKTMADIESVKKLGANGAMIGRAMLGNPWIFAGPGIKRNEPAIILEHLDLMVEYYGVRTGVPSFRKHAAWYASGRSGVGQFRHRVNRITNHDDMKTAIQEFFS